MKMYASVMFTLMNIKIGTQLSVNESDIFYQNPFRTFKQEHADEHTTRHNLPYKHSVYVLYMQNA